VSGAYKVNKIAYSKAEYGTQKVLYYINDCSVSKKDFETYLMEQRQKQNAEWNVFT